MKWYDKCNENSIVLLGTIINKKPMVFCAVTSDITSKIHAGNIVREIGENKF